MRCCVVTIASFLLLICTMASARAQVVWSDEFNGDSIDRSIWTYDVGGHGFGNGQLEFNTARRENSYIKDGKLVLEARREDYQGKAFTSARMHTQGRFAFQYGTMEARIKLPDTANGIWPAFWMLGNNFPGVNWPLCGEIDILEMGGREGIKRGLQQRRINCAIHFAEEGSRHAFRDAWLDAPVDLNRDYHVFRMDWTPKHLKFYLDGAEYGSWDISDEKFREFHQPFFPILNVAVGSREDSYTGVSSPEKVTAPFPARMYVDWIRVTKNEHTRVVLGNKLAETGPFGVFSEKKGIKNALTIGGDQVKDFAYGDSAALYSWNNMKSATATAAPSEGSAAWSFDIDAGNWFGMGVFAPKHRNMQNYADGLLHFDVRTTSATPFRVGIKSSRGEAYLPVGDQNSEFGFARDGKWHTVSLPLARFNNVDFQTVHQFFMVTGEAPSENLTIAFDNIWWEPGAARLRLQAGNYGIFTHRAPYKTAGEFKPGSSGNFYIWDKTLLEQPTGPSEGRKGKRLTSAPGLNWFGAAWTPNVKSDLSGLDPQSKLCFAIRTTAKTTFQIGMKSGTIEGIGQKWIPFAAGSDPYGFARDGKWHTVEIPLSEFATEVDLAQVSHLFEILGTDGPISDLEVADIYIAGLARVKTP